MNKPLRWLVVLGALALPAQAQHPIGHPTGEIPDAVWPADAVRTVKDGLANDPNVYSNKKVPGAATKVIVDHNLSVDGELTFRQLWIRQGTVQLMEGAYLRAFGSISVWDGAALRADRVAARIDFYVEDDRNCTHITSFEPVDMDLVNNIGLYEMPGGELKLLGKPKTEFVRAASAGEWMPVPSFRLIKDNQQSNFVDLSSLGVYERPAIQGGTATLAIDVAGWEPGDVLALCALDGRKVYTALQSIQGRSITFADKTFRANGIAHIRQSVSPAGPSTATVGRAVITRDPIIANVTRSIQIVSALVRPGDYDHRAHTITLHHAHSHWEYVELRNLGPRGKLGLYPRHDHHAHGGHDDNRKGLAIWQDVPDDGNRGIVCHFTDGIRYEKNLIFDDHGMGFYMEGGTETGNRVVDNIEWKRMRRGNYQGAIDPSIVEGDELANLTINGQFFGVLDHDNYSNSGGAGFWLRAGNEIHGNISGNSRIGIAVLYNRAGDRTQHVVVQDHESYGCWWAVWEGAYEATVQGVTGIACMSFARLSHGMRLFLDGCNAILCTAGLDSWHAGENIVKRSTFLTEEMFIDFTPVNGYLEDCYIRTAHVVGWVPQTQRFNYTLRNCDFRSSWNFAGRFVNSLGAHALPASIQWINCTGFISHADHAGVVPLGDYAAYATADHDLPGYDGAQLAPSRFTNSKPELWKRLSGPLPPSVLLQLQFPHGTQAYSIQAEGRTEGPKEGTDRAPYVGKRVPPLLREGGVFLPEALGRLLHSDDYANRAWGLPPGRYRVRWYGAPAASVVIGETDLEAR